MLAVLALRGAEAPGDRRLLFGALLVAAMSSEFGQVVAVAFCVFGAAVLISSRERPGVWLVLPALIGAALVSLVFVLRFAKPEMTLAGSPTLGNLLASAAAAVPQSAADLWPLASPGAAHAATPFGIAIVLLVGLACCALWRRLGARPDAGLLLAFAAALLVATYAASAVALYHFGWPCCERNIAMQHGSGIVVVAALAAILARKIAVPVPLGAASLVSAVLIPAFLWAPLYRDALAAWPGEARAKQLTWASGRAAGHGEMQLTWCVRCTLFRYDAYAVAGRWAWNRDTPWAQRSVMDFFAKTALVQLPDTNVKR